MCGYSKLTSDVQILINKYLAKDTVTIVNKGQPDMYFIVDSWDTVKRLEMQLNEATCRKP